jgi:hypothetical protein
MDEVHQCRVVDVLKKFFMSGDDTRHGRETDRSERRS